MAFLNILNCCHLLSFSVSHHFVFHHFHISKHVVLTRLWDPISLSLVLLPFYWTHCFNTISHLLPFPFFPSRPASFFSPAEDYAGIQFQFQPVLRNLHRPAAVSFQATQRLNRGQMCVCFCDCVLLCVFLHCLPWGIQYVTGVFMFLFFTSAYFHLVCIYPLKEMLWFFK